MVAKVLAGVGLFLALVAIILKSVALSVPHFVDVHLVNDPNDASDENRLGGVGVFQSEFDSDLEGDILDDINAANVPIITITTPTLEFPLLFPSQENFFATVLPIDSAALEILDDEIPGAALVIGSQVEAVNALELIDDNCTAFAEDLEATTKAFFVVLQSGIIPSAVVALQPEIAEGAFDTIFAAIENIPLVLIAAQQVASSTAFASADLIAAAEANAACENIEISSDLVIDGTTRSCLAVLFSIANSVEPSPFVAFIIDLVSSEVACPDASALTVDGCIVANSNKYVVDDTNIFEADPATFVNDDEPRACDEVFLNCTTKEDFLTAVAVLVASFQAEVSGGIFAYINLVVNAEESFSTGGTFAEKFSGWPATSAAQAALGDSDTRSTEYQPCTIIVPILEVNQTCENIQQFFELLPGILEKSGSELAPTVAAIAGIYTTFFELGEIPLENAPLGFATALIEGGFNTEFETSDSTAEIIQNCADDVEDNEKIAQAQALSIASAIFEALSLLLIVAGIILPVEKLAYLAPAAAISGVLGGAFIIGALLVTQSAPVYEGVGDTEVDESGEAEIFFIQGYVPLLALVDAVLFFLSGVVLIVSTVFACKESGSDIVNDDVKEDLAMEDKI